MGDGVECLDLPVVEQAKKACAAALCFEGRIQYHFTPQQVQMADCAQDVFTV